MHGWFSVGSERVEIQYVVAILGFVQNKKRGVQQSALETFIQTLCGKQPAFAGTFCELLERGGYLERDVTNTYQLTTKGHKFIGDEAPWVNRPKPYQLN